MTIFLILSLFIAEHSVFSAFHDDSCEEEESVHSPTVQDFNGTARSDTIPEDPESQAYQLKHLLYPAYDFPEIEGNLLKQKVNHVTQENSKAIQTALQMTTKCKRVFPFACDQRIFAWYLTPSNSEISIKSFIPAFRETPDEQLVEIDEALRTLPLFFSRSAFNQVIDGYLEGDTLFPQKWLNVAATCRAVNDEVLQLVDADEGFEVGYHLMHFMQYRSKDLIRYYVEALAENVRKIEDRYYPLYCLSRRLKEHDELQYTLLRALKEKHDRDFEGLFAEATELIDTIKRKRYDGAMASLFINQFVEESSGALFVSEFVEEPTGDPQKKLIELAPDL